MIELYLSCISVMSLITDGGQAALFPGLFDDIEKALKVCKAVGGLGSFPDGKKDVEKELVPVMAFFLSHLAGHGFKVLVNVFHKVIILGLIHRDLFYLQQPTDKQGALIHQDVFWYLHME